jgi:hypothetical protein
MKENGIMPTNGTVDMDDCVKMLKTPTTNL